MAKSLTLVFRHYREDLYSSRSRDPNKKRPKWFSNELCFKSLAKSILESNYSIDCQVLIWYDGTEEDLNTDPVIAIASELAKETKVSLLRKDYSHSGNNAGESLSWGEMATYTLQQFNTDIIYFVENDYIHRTHAVDGLFEIFNSSEQISYLSLADHLDYYHLPIHEKRMTSLRYSRNYIYREVFTTTGTFAVRYNVFLEDLPVFLDAKVDFRAFTHLTGIKGRILVAPLPALAGHCMTNLLPPAVNWDSVAELVGSSN